MEKVAGDLSDPGLARPRFDKLLAAMSLLIATLAKNASEAVENSVPQDIIRGYWLFDETLSEMDPLAKSALFERIRRGPPLNQA